MRLQHWQTNQNEQTGSLNNNDNCHRDAQLHQSSGTSQIYLAI